MMPDATKVGANKLEMPIKFMFEGGCTDGVAVKHFLFWSWQKTGLAGAKVIHLQSESRLDWRQFITLDFQKTMQVVAGGEGTYIHYWLRHGSRLAQRASYFAVQNQGYVMVWIFNGWESATNVYFFLITFEL